MSQQIQSLHLPRLSRLKLLIALAVGCLSVGTFTQGQALVVRAATADVGYRDFSFGNTGLSSPTGEKPESKLWWNDGVWWGSLYNNAAQEYHIYRLNWTTQTWVDTGTVLDDRNMTKGDALWDNANQKLYLVSHIMVDVGVPSTDPAEWGRLYRYSYNSQTQTYSLDAGFPTSVTQGKSETLTVAKDSTSRLWVTYVENGKVMINHSTTSDAVWGVPFALSFADATNLTTDDIAAVISFQANKIGVMWSNQNDKKMYFAVHLDGAADTTWQPEETALPGPSCTGSCADDHINLKSVQVDGTGRVFAAIKTSLTASSAPLIMLLVRSFSGTWDGYVFGRVSDNHTRPIVLLDEEHGKVYMFATASGVIYLKSTDINNIQFPLGLGTPFIQSSLDLDTNNATSTKQNVNSTTGLVVLAGDYNTKYYLHNYQSLVGSNPTPTFTPTSTPLPTATNTPLPTSTNTPPPTATNTPLPTPTNTPSPIATSTPLPTATNTPLPTATNTPLPTATSIPLPTSTNTPLSTATNTPLLTPTNTQLPTATNTPLPTATNTPLPTATNTPFPTATSTPLPTATNTPLPTPTSTPLPPTNTPTATNTLLPTATSTPTPTPTVVVIVSSITPNSMKVGTTISVTIGGSNFSTGAILTFENGVGPAPTVSNLVVVNAGTITATLTEKTGGLRQVRVWDVRVTNPGGSSGVLKAGFTVIP